MSKPEATFSPLVAEGVALRLEVEDAKQVKEAAEKALSDANARLAALNGRLLALGLGLRFCDESGNSCLTVAGRDPVKAPDRFVIGAEDIPRARELAGDSFRTLFSRSLVYAPREGFAALANAVLTPAKARDITALCLIPGKLGGGQSSYVKWK